MNGLYLTLPIFLPLVGGLVSYLIRFPSSRSRHLFYGVLICLTSAVTWLSILRCGSESFQLLRFTEELTLTLRMDGASRLFAGLAATLWPFTMLYAFDYMSHEKHLSMFWSFFTVSFGVTLGVAFAGNMMTMYLFYELLTLATLPLVMQPMSTTARKAGVKYAVYSMSGAALAFIGLVFLIVNGAQDFTLGGHLAGYTGDRQLLLTVFVLAFVGFGVKAAIWPLHAWLPAAAVAPTPVTALLHAVAVVKSGAFACIRLIYYAFGTEILVGTWAQQAVMTLTLITILFASCMSVKQRHFKRRLAYSTVSNLSYILFAAPHRPLRGEDPGLLHRRSRAALQSPGVRPSAGGAGQADARDLRVLHGGGLRPDGRPPLQRLCQQVVHRSGGGGHLSAPAHHRLRRAAGVGAADGYLYVPDRGPGMVPPAQRSGHSGGLRP